jgi:hypothetical protein
MAGRLLLPFGKMMSVLADEVIRNYRRSSVICFLTSVVWLFAPATVHWSIIWHL